MDKVFIVTGAPGSGKTRVIEELLKTTPSNMIFFDIDSIINDASELAGRDVHFEPETWVPFRKIWVSILKSVLDNGRIPVLFAASDKNDFENLVSDLNIIWIALDCDDKFRADRLRYRNYSEKQLEEIMKDAEKIRSEVGIKIDTTELSPNEVADELLSLLSKGEN